MALSVSASVSPSAATPGQRVQVLFAVANSGPSPVNVVGFQLSGVGFSDLRRVIAVVPPGGSIQIGDEGAYHYYGVPNSDVNVGGAVYTSDGQQFVAYANLHILL